MPVSQPMRLAGALAVVTAITLSGCSATESASDPGAPATTRTFHADNGDIKIPADPKRVVETYAVPALIETGAALVGISTWARGESMMSGEDRSTYDRLPKVAGELAAETDYEAVAQARPDLIVIGVPKPVLGDIDLERLASIAPVITLGPNTPQEWRDTSRRQTDAAGRLDEFDKLKSAYDKKAAALKDEYADTLSTLDFAHVGGYGDASAGNFQREFAGSWGTNAAGDLGVRYYGEVKTKGPGSASVSEYPSIEELPTGFAEADAITYTLEPDGSVGKSVQYVLDSPLWQNLPAAKAGMVFPVRYTQAATYGAAILTLGSLDETLAPLRERG